MKILRLINTIKYLKPIQIRYQLWYRIHRYWRRLTGFKYPLSIQKEGTSLNFTPWIEKSVFFDKYTFTFLNQSKRLFPPFRENQRGSESQGRGQKGVGKLWAYNLNYMDYLLQPGMDATTGNILIEQFIAALPNNKTGLEPYPIALRGINWIKFLSHHCEERPKGATKQSPQTSTINSSLYAQYKILFDNLEYHLLGNHLLEDGFSLLFGAFYFNDQSFYKKAGRIIRTELEEQILDDGGHFELSPMYHQIILDRLLDCINLLKNNQLFDNQVDLSGLMEGKAIKMWEWLNSMTFSNGQIPLLNDSAPGVAPTTEQINHYAIHLNVISEDVSGIRLNPCLKESGYRRFNGSSYECIIDIGQIGSSYQPGHAHADTFNFVININNKPFIVDTGISTYEANSTRMLERGTAAHNTVTMKDLNSSEVWASFRIARRAKVEIIKEDEKTVIAEHNGYRNIGIIHQRKWEFNENHIGITDTLKGNISEGKAYICLAPFIKPVILENQIKTQAGVLTFENGKRIEIIKSKIPNGYNQFTDNYKIEITFKHHLKTIMTPH